MKIRSSRELKESIQNVDRVIENELLDTTVAIDPVLADAYEQNKEIELQVEKTLEELADKAEDVVLKSPEATMEVENAYTQQLKLDESIEDFDLVKDGRSRKVATRGEDEGNRYLDYSMFDFVSELLTGKDCNTNPAPITPIVWRRDPKTNKFRYMEMKKFMTQGEDSVSYGGSNEAGAFSYDDEDSDEIANSTETKGMYKSIGVPQIGIEDDAFRVYSDSLEDLEQAQQGLSHYGIKYDNPEPKRSKTSHWDFSMKVYIPTDNKGEILSLTDWLIKTGRHIEDVMRPKFVSSYNKLINKQYSNEDKQLVKDIFDSYIAKSNSDSTISTDALLADMFDELEGLPYDKETLEADFRAAVEGPTYYDIFDKYIERIEDNPSLNPDKVFNAMCKELKVNKIKFNIAEAKEEFMSEIE